MDLLRLRLVNFLSYVDKTITFDAPVILLTGPNGAGKSTIFSGVTTALFKRARGVTGAGAGMDRLIRDGQTAMGVECTFQLGEHEVMVRFLKKVNETPIHKIVVNGKLDTVTTKGVVERVQELLAVDYDTFVSSVFLEQGQSDLFLRKTSRERRAVLEKILQLEKFQEWAQKARDERTKANNSSISAGGKVDLVTNQIASLEKELQGTSIPTMEQQIKELRELRNKHQVLFQQFDQWKTKVQDLERYCAEQERDVNQLRSRINPPDPPDLEFWERMVLSTDQKRGESVRKKLALDMEGATLYHEVSRLSTELLKWREVGECCPTCKRPWETEKLEERIRLVSGIEQSILDKRGKSEGFKPEQRQLVSSIEELDKQLVVTRRNVENLRYNDPVALSEEVKQREQRLIEARGNLAELNRQPPSVVTGTSIQNMDQNIAHLISRIANAESGFQRLQELRGTLSKLETEKVESKQNWDVWSALVEAFSERGLPRLLVDSALPQLKDYTNKVLEVLTGGNIGIEFQSDEKNLEVMVRAGGSPRLYELCSGGERFQVDFGLRIALSLLLAHRAGVKLETIFLDEGMASLDRVNRDAFVEMIQKLGESRLFKKLIVVTHVADISEAFDNRIEIFKDPEKGTCFLNGQTEEGK